MAKFNISGLDHVAIAVADIEVSREFYERVLGFERLYPQWKMPVVMGVGGTGVAIFHESVHPSKSSKLWGSREPGVRILHIAFRVDREGFEAAKAGLAPQGVGALFSDHGLSHSLYFNDPDGHQIELTTYDV